MYLMISIFLSLVLGYLLSFIDPVIGGLIAFGIIAGTLFRILYLINDIHKRISKITPKPDQVKEAYESYLNEKKQE